MAGFGGHERLMELLEEVPRDSEDVLGRGRALHAAAVERIEELARLRDSVEGLAGEVRSALGAFEEVATSGTERVTQQADEAVRTAEETGGALATDVESVAAEVEAATGAETEAVAALARAAERVTTAATASGEAVAELAARLAEGSAPPTEAADADADGASSYAEAMEAAGPLVAASVEVLLETLDGAVEGFAEAARGGLANVGEAAEGVQQRISGVAGRIGDWRHTTVDDLKARLEGEIAEHLVARAIEIGDLAARLQSQLDEVASSATAGRDRLEGSFSDLRDRVGTAGEVSATTLHIVAELGL